MAETEACMVCGDIFDQHATIQLCNEHVTCAECFRDAVRIGLNNEALFPIQCGFQSCDTIPTFFIETILDNTDQDDQSLLQEFRRKTEEYGVEALERRYCANLKCSAAKGESCFLNTRVMGDGIHVECPDCESTTCIQCKELVDPKTGHTCEPETIPNSIQEFLAAVPEEERWLHRRCFQCGNMIEKVDSCNHMTCTCEAEFCLICGRRWPSGAHTRCTWGCPKDGPPVYDDAGYSETGFHFETGMNREGVAFDELFPQDTWPVEDGLLVDDAWRQWSDEDDLPVDDAWSDDDALIDGDSVAWGPPAADQVWDEQGFDQDGYGRDGFGRDGYDRDGFGRDGYERDGRDRLGFNIARRNTAGFFDDLADMDGFNREGKSFFNLPREEYGPDGFDFVYGRDVWGLDRDGMDRDGNEWNENGDQIRWGFPSITQQYLNGWRGPHGRR